VFTGLADKYLLPIHFAEVKIAGLHVSTSWTWHFVFTYTLGSRGRNVAVMPPTDTEISSISKPVAGLWINSSLFNRALRQVWTGPISQSS
jgi:hypothetical protein